MTITSTFTPFFLSIPLYHLVHTRLFPPSVYDLVQQEVDAAKRNQEGRELAEDIVQPEGNGPSIPGGMGGDFATGAARGFSFARSAVTAYTSGTENGLQEDDAVNMDILKPHVQSVVNRVLPASTGAQGDKASIEGLTEDRKAGGKKGKTADTEKPKSKVPSKTTRLHEKWEAFKVNHGTGLIIVLDDLSVGHVVKLVQYENSSV